MKLLNLLSEIEINKPGYELINKENDDFSFKGSKKAILNLVKSWIIEEPDNWGLLHNR
jgi:hypothetical protein